MNQDTGEIREFDEDIPEGWTGLEFLGKGKRLDLHGLQFEIMESTICVGTPGSVGLKLKAIPQKTIMQEHFNDLAGAHLPKSFSERMNTGGKYKP